MNKEISYYSADKSNVIKGYTRFFNTKAYLYQKSGELVYYKEDNNKAKEIADSLGYQDFEVFINDRAKWHELEERIPLYYLEEIGAELDVLKFTVELDQNESEKALEINTSPKYAAVRDKPGVYQNIKLPYNITENEAIEFLKDYALQEDKTCCLNYPDLKTIWISPKGNLKMIYYIPEIKISGQYLVPEIKGRKFGEVYSK